ncbi:MAG: EVE domain-containing protein [archaeon]|nr:EVE domain-containing protein [archaeon]MDA0842501.1 EVE domain-containing protein [archaeon]
MGYWLMKSELDVYPYSKLIEDGSTHWDGVRNYQARNFMRDDMKKGDYVLFYHSNCNPPHIAGIAKIVKEGYPDHTSWDSNSKYFDEKSTPSDPRWMMVDIAPVHEFKEIICLDELKLEPELESMLLLRKGQRLSVQPVEEQHFNTILRLAKVSKNVL